MGSVASSEAGGGVAFRVEDSSPVDVCLDLTGVGMPGHETDLVDVVSGFGEAGDKATPKAVPGELFGVRCRHHLSIDEASTKDVGDGPTPKLLATPLDTSQTVDRSEQRLFRSNVAGFATRWN